MKRKRSKTNIERKSSKTKISTTTQYKTTIEQLKALNIKNNKGKPPSRSNSSTNQTEVEEFNRQIKHLQEEIDKARFIKKEPIVCKPIMKPINRATKTTAKKIPDGLHHRRRPTTKYRNHKRYRFYRTNHANTKKLWRTVEATTRHRFGTVGNVIILSSKAFTNQAVQLP